MKNETNCPDRKYEPKRVIYLDDSEMIDEFCGKFCGNDCGDCDNECIELDKWLEINGHRCPDFHGFADYRKTIDKSCKAIQALKKENEELKREFRNMRDWCHEDSDWFKHMDAFIEKKECQLNCNFCYANQTKTDS